MSKPGEERRSDALRLEPPAKAISSEAAGWEARLRLGFTPHGSRTAVRTLERLGPLCIQRPFYPEGDVCHVYVLHPPGGLVGGDRHALSIDVHRGAAALVTTPASTKVYRTVGPPCLVTQKLRVHAAGQLEWLPLDTILFGGSRLSVRTEVYLDPRAHFVGWEVTSLGRPRSGDAYRSGGLDQRTMLHVQGAPRLLEHQRWCAGDDGLRAPWGLGGATALGTFYAYPAAAEALQRARTWADNANPWTAGATLLDDLLVARALGSNAVAIREGLLALWSILRSLVIGRSPCPPRVWAT